MRVCAECTACIVERAKCSCEQVLDRDEDKLRTLKRIFEFLGRHFSSDVVPAFLGTNIEKIILEESRGKDTYSTMKSGHTKTAEIILPQAEAFYGRLRDKTEALLRIGAAANSMDYGIRGHSIDFNYFHQSFAGLLENYLTGSSREVEEALNRFDRILYMVDNAGEAVLDLYIAGKLAERGKEVVLAAKREPILLDVTAAELRPFSNGMKVLETGSSIGLFLDDCSEEFRQVFEDPRYLIISKGMAHYETISEYADRIAGRLIYILTAKCTPVATSLGVSKGDLVVQVAR